MAAVLFGIAVGEAVVRTQYCECFSLCELVHIYTHVWTFFKSLFVL